MYRLTKIVAALLLQVTLAQAQTVELTFDGDSSGIAVIVLSDQNDTDGTPIEPVDGRFSFTVPPDDTVWRREPVFIITLPERTLANGIDTPQVDLELAFSFRPTDIDTITVPFQMFDAIGNAERQRIDQLLRHQRFNKILLAQALAKHYMPRRNVQAETQFMTTTWFDALYAGIVRDKRPLRLGGAIEDMLEPVLVGDSRLIRIRDAVTEIKARLWLDKDRLPGLLREGRCDAARALVGFLTSLHTDDATLAANPAVQIRDPAAVLADLERQTETACSS